MSDEIKLAEMQAELGRLKAENIRLRRDLIDPPADVQELVIQKLKLVSADAIQQEMERWRKIVENAPELPGRMSDAMWLAICNDRYATEMLMHAAVQQTKINILETAAASSVAATRVKSDDHAVTQGEQKS